MTLEACANSATKKMKIIQESAKRTLIREEIIKGASQAGEILVKNKNVCYHVMQAEHRWDKLIKLSGNAAEDFKKIKNLLKDNGILSEKNFLRSKKFAQDKIIRSDYKMKINECEVQAVFETYVETNEVFLKDAWVITK
jgi:phosphate-selective porin